MTFSPERSALRGVGASAVVASHAAQLAAVSFGALAIPIGLLGNLGWMGVSLFLSLSIFLLLGSLDANPDLRHYFARRIKRIWPLYFAMCGVLFLLFDHDLGDLTWNVSFLAVFDPAHAFHNSAAGAWPTTYVVWTLQVEEWAYLCFPLIALLGHRARLAVGFGLVATLGVGAFVPLNYFTPWPWLCCYGFGLLAYESRGSLERWGWWLLLGVPVGFAVGWPLGLLAIGPVAAWAVAHPPGWLKRRALVAVGESSYGLYLTHLLVLDYLGLPGLAVAYPLAFGSEALQRGREMVRRVRAVNRAPGSIQSPRPEGAAES